MDKSKIKNIVREILKEIKVNEPNKLTINFVKNNLKEILQKTKAEERDEIKFFKNISEDDPFIVINTSYEDEDEDEDEDEGGGFSIFLIDRKMNDEEYKKYFPFDPPMKEINIKGKLIYYIIV